MKQSLPDNFLAILLELDPPTILSSIVHIMRMIFALYSVSFGQRYAVTKAQNGNFGDISCAVWIATWAKSVKMVKPFPPGTVTLLTW